MCDQKDCKHEKIEPVHISSRDMKIGQALFSTLALRYHGGDSSHLLNAGGCMMNCTKPGCQHNREFRHALVQAIDHVDNDAPLAAYEEYAKMYEQSQGFSIQAMMIRIFGPVAGQRLLDESAVIDMVIVDDKAGLVFDDADELDEDDASMRASSALTPTTGVLH